MYVKPEFNSIFLNLTDACNLRCKYCFVEKHPHYMDLQVAKDAVDMMVDIHKHQPYSTMPHIQFFGGEPTLMWDTIIVPLIEYCKEKDVLNKEVKFGITTNGILLDDAKMDFLQENNISVLFSIDGTKETQDFNRPCVDLNKSSFDILEPKIAEIAKRFHCTFRGTLLPETCHNLFDNIMYAAGFEFENCFFIPDWSNKGWTQDKIDILSREIRKYSMYFIDCYRQGLEPFKLSSYTRSIEHLATYYKYQQTHELDKRHCGFCGLGLGAAGINWEGKIFACQELPSIGTRDNIYYIGDIYHGIDPAKRQKLLDMYLNNMPTCEGSSKPCETCAYRPMCMNNTCHASCYMRCGDLNSRSAVECFWDRKTTEEAIFVSNVLIKNKNELFMKDYNLTETKIDDMR